MAVKHYRREFESYPQSSSEDDISSWLEQEGKRSLIARNYSSKIVNLINTHFIENPHLLSVCYGSEDEEDVMVDQVCGSVLVFFYPIIRWLVMQLAQRLIILYLKRHDLWPTAVSNAVSSFRSS